MPDKEKPLVVFAIENNGGEDRPYWHKVGTATKNADGSIDLTLFMFPLLRFQIR